MKTSIAFKSENSYNWTLRTSSSDTFILKFDFEKSFGNSPLLTVTIDLTAFQNNINFVMVNKESTINLISYDKLSDKDDSASNITSELSSFGKKST